MPQRGGKASLAVHPRGGWVLRRRLIALPQHVSPAQDRSRVVYVVRVRNTESGDWATLVKAGRISVRLSQLALAKAVGVSRETVWRWETGRQKPENAEVVGRLSKVIHQDYDELMRAAGLALVEPETAPEPDARLRGLDPRDPVVVHIMNLNVDEEMRGFMLDRRRQQIAERNEQDIREIEFWANRRSGAA